MRFSEEGRERRFTGLLYADDLVLCGELEEDLSNYRTFSQSMQKERICS